jgi:hypothetical protein
VKNEGESSLNTLNALDNYVQVLMRLEEWPEVRAPPCAKGCGVPSRVALQALEHATNLVNQTGSALGQTHPMYSSGLRKVCACLCASVCACVCLCSLFDDAACAVTSPGPQVGNCAVRVGNAQTVVTATMIVRARRTRGQRAQPRRVFARRLTRALPRCTAVPT